MNNKIIKKAISLVVAFVATIGLFAGAVTAQAADTKQKNATKYKLYLDMEIANNQDKGYAYSHPGSPDQLDNATKNMWKNIPITVVDAQGNTTVVKKELDSACRRYVGEFIKDQKVKIKLDTSGISDGYSIAWSRDYSYPDESKNYAEFEVIPDASVPVRISFSHMKVKFDLQEGNINGNSDSIEKFVNKDNSVNFPDNPTKANLVFGGWFTQLPDIKAYQQRGIVGKRYYWDHTSLFSDYNRDWQQWNDVKVDPLYDGIFLLRAQWNARATFNANGGVFNNKNENTKDEVTIAGKKITIAQAPTREDYQFLNWVDAAGTTYNPGDTYTLNANTVFTAQWKQIQSTVTFKDGNKTQTVKVETGKAIDTDALTGQSMPANPTKAGYTFKEWNTKEDGTGETFTGASVVNSDMTVYAIYTKKDTPSPTPYSYNTVTFKDGDSTVATVNVESGNSIDDDYLTDESMPKNPTKDGYTFKEWNTQADGTGVKFTGKTVVNSDMAVYAIYVEDASDIPDFPNISTPNPVPLTIMSPKTVEPEPSEPELASEPEPASEPEHKPVEEQGLKQVAVHALPKTGESASLVAIFASLAFFVAGLLMLQRKKVVRENK